MSLCKLIYSKIIIFSFFSCATKQITFNDDVQKIISLSKEMSQEFGVNSIESLTTLVGARFPGSPQDAMAVQWAVDQMQSFGFSNIHKQPVQFPRWLRGSASVEITSPTLQNLTVTALGGSGATPKNGVEAEIIRFGSLEELEKADPRLIKGKVVFMNFAMKKSKDGKYYGQGYPIRSKGPQIAHDKGALAYLIRSIGTDTHRFAHTGSIARMKENFAALSMSAPDAMQLDRLIDRHLKVKVHVKAQNEWLGEVTSYNVIGEIPGDGSSDEYILMGAHLDSWDLGTGALDDASGVGVVLGAAKVLSKMKLKRAIRVVLFANEEQGLIGAKAYAKDNDMSKIFLAYESDAGARYIYEMQAKVPPSYNNYVLDLAKTLKEMNIDFSTGKCDAGPDIMPLMEKNVPAIGLSTDSTDYFDYHHTPDDTFDKVIPATIEQNIMVFAISAYKASMY